MPVNLSPPPPMEEYAKTDPLRRVILVLSAWACYGLAYLIAHLQTPGSGTVATTFVLCGTAMLFAPARRPTQSGFLALVEAVKGRKDGSN